MHARFRYTLSSMAVALAACRSGSVPAPAADSAAPIRPVVSEVEVPGLPSQVLLTRDGEWIAVSTMGQPTSQISLFRRNAPRPTVVYRTPVKGDATGMVFTHDGSVLIVTVGNGVAFIDAHRLIGGDGESAVLGYLREPGRLATVQANVTRDDHWLFVSNEFAHSISVIDLAKARSSGFGTDSVVGRIAVGGSPIALTFSSDQRYLFTTSEVAPRALGYPIECAREEARAAGDATAAHAKGAVIVVDVARATTDPANSVIGAVPAGCSPVRLALSPKGDIAYVTARGDDDLLAFDAQGLVGDRAHAFLGKVHVGPAPVGVAVIDEGRKVAVTLSNRWAAPMQPQWVSVVDVTKIRSNGATVLGRIAVGAFPRNLTVSDDGRTLYVINFNSRSLEIIDLTRLAEALRGS